MLAALTLSLALAHPPGARPHLLDAALTSPVAGDGGETEGTAWRIQGVTSGIFLGLIGGQVAVYGQSRDLVLPAYALGAAVIGTFGGIVGYYFGHRADDGEIGSMLGIVIVETLEAVAIGAELYLIASTPPPF